MNNGPKKSEGKFKNFLKVTKMDMSTCQNIWDIAKLILEGKLITISTYIKKQENIKQPKNTSPRSTKQEQIQLKVIREEELIKDQSTNK